MTNGRRKGAEYERKMSKVLTLWSGVPFDRVFRSGGGKNKGDIGPAYGMWDFVLEIKNRESWNHSNFWERKGPIWMWWDKVSSEAGDANKVPLLILKKNHRDALIMFPPSFLRKVLSDDFSAPYIVGKDFAVTTLDAFLSNLDPKKVISE